MPHRIKGDPIRITGGKYAGRKGWKHKEKGETDSQIYLILQKVEKNGRVVEPEKTVRVDKSNYMPFVKTVAPIQNVIAQKPKLQEKMSTLIKELVKLDVQPTEDFLVVFGHQWLTMWERKMAYKAVDYTRPDEEPLASDDEDAAEVD